MMTVLQNVTLSAVAAALPRREIFMTTFETQYGASEVQRIIAGTGIQSVRVAEHLTTGDLCAAAARSLLDGRALKPSMIDGLVVVTQTPDRLMPGTAALLQRKLGLPQDTAVIDINSGCSGYIYGLYVAGMMIASGGCARVLLLTGDVITKLLHEEDRHVRMVFGDAATASLIERGSSAFSIEIKSNGDGGQHLGTALQYCSGDHTLQGGHLHMNGAEVMGFVVGQVPRLINDFLNRQGLKKEDIPLFVMHQANKLILSYLRRQMRLNEVTLPDGAATVGNTGPSSIPLFMAMHQTSGFNQSDLERVVLCGFGVGLSLGAAMVDLRNTTFIPPVDLEDPYTAAA